MYTTNQLENLLCVGADACKAAGYDKDFVDAAYEQITSAIAAQERTADPTWTFSNGSTAAVFAEDELDEELKGIVSVNDLREQNGFERIIDQLVADVNELSTTEKCEVILLVLLDKLNWGSVVSLTLGEQHESNSRWQRTAPGGEKVFEAIVPLYCDKQDRDVADFDYMVDQLYKEIAQVFGRGIR